MESARFRQWRDLGFESLNTLSWQELPEQKSDKKTEDPNQSSISA